MPGLMLPPQTEQESAQLWTVRDVATFLRCKPKQVYAFIQNEGLPYISIVENGRYLFDRNDVMKWVETRKRVNEVTREAR